VLTFSDDDGKSWSDAQLMILPRRGVRAMSATNWIDPLGRLWVFWGHILLGFLISASPLFVFTFTLHAFNK
jgi:hypothetical protein